MLLKILIYLNRGSKLLAEILQIRGVVVAYRKTWYNISVNKFWWYVERNVINNLAKSSHWFCNVLLKL